jgi:hypothetical protein
VFHVCERREMCRTNLFGVVFKERDRLENLDMDGKIVLKYVLEKCVGIARVRFVCPRIRLSGVLLWTQFHTMPVISYQRL